MSELLNEDEVLPGYKFQCEVQFHGSFIPYEFFHEHSVCKLYSILMSTEFYRQTDRRGYKNANMAKKVREDAKK